jgi:hypothetical protein
VEFLSIILPKCGEQAEFLAQFLSKSLSNEKAIGMQLRALKYFNADPALLEFCLKLIPRVKQ